MVPGTIPVKGTEEAKKKPPKLIERVIDKFEEVLTAPVEPQSKGEEKPKKPMPQSQKQPQNPEQAQMQGSLGGQSEFVLPKGTTIRLPDGNEFETQTESTLAKKGGEE
jgi:hypothetical protein